MPLLSLADFDKSLKLNQMLLNPLLSSGLFGAQLNTLVPKQTSYSRYKTELCRQFSENGQCKYGDKCQFAHGVEELKDVKRHPKYKTDFCKTFHSKGFCPYGPRCHFIHELSESMDLANGLSSVCGRKKQDTLDTLQLTNSLLLNIKSELESGAEKFDCHEERTMMPDFLDVNGSVSLNASPSSTTSSSSSLNDLFARQLISPKNSDSVRTRSSVSSTSSVFSSTSTSTSSSSVQNPFDNSSFFNLVGLASQVQSQTQKTNYVIW